jgi:hypothetical protein
MSLVEFQAHVVFFKKNCGALALLSQNYKTDFVYPNNMP